MMHVVLNENTLVEKLSSKLSFYQSQPCHSMCVQGQNNSEQEGEQQCQGLTTNFDRVE